MIDRALCEFHSAFVTVASEFPYGPSMFNGLLVVDVQSPEQPVLLRSLTLEKPPRTNGKGIRLAGDYAYVVAGNQLLVLSLSALRTP